MADVAFLVMDLRDRGRPDLAARFLSGYLERTGDYDGVQILRFYIVYRAMVRAKVACMRANQIDEAARAAKIAEYQEYLSLAARCCPARCPGHRDHARAVRIGQDHTVGRPRRVRRRHPHPDGRRTQTHPRADATGSD